MVTELLVVLRCHNCSYYTHLDSSTELSSDEQCRLEPEEEVGTGNCYSLTPFTHGFLNFQGTSISVWLVPKLFPFDFSHLCFRRGRWFQPVLCHHNFFQLDRKRCHTILYSRLSGPIRQVQRRPRHENLLLWFRLLQWATTEWHKFNNCDNTLGRIHWHRTWWPISEWVSKNSNWLQWLFRV